eukprot:3310667-Pleurochrysis_carterae.AAC.1
MPAEILKRVGHAVGHAVGDGKAGGEPLEGRTESGRTGPVQPRGPWGLAKGAWAWGGVGGGGGRGRG